MFEQRKRDKEERISEAISRAKEAEAFVNHPAFKRSIDAVEKNLIRELRNSGWQRVFYRHAIYNRLAALSLLQDQVVAEIESGELATRDLNSNGSK